MAAGKPPRGDVFWLALVLLLQPIRAALSELSNLLVGTALKRELCILANRPK